MNNEENRAAAARAAAARLEKERAAAENSAAENSAEKTAPTAADRETRRRLNAERSPQIRPLEAEQEIKLAQPAEAASASVQETQTAENRQELPEAAPKPTSPPAAISTSIASIPASSGPIQAEILDVRVFEPRTSTRLSPSEKRLRVELHFRISGLQADPSTVEYPAFQVSIYSVDLSTKAAHLVASDAGSLQSPQEFVSTIQKEFLLPEPGRYEFHSILLLLPPYTQMKSYQGPILQVVPWYELSE